MLQVDYRAAGSVNAQRFACDMVSVDSWVVCFYRNGVVYRMYAIPAIGHLYISEISEKGKENGKEAENIPG